MANQSKIRNSPRRRDARLEIRDFAAECPERKKERKANNKILRETPDFMPIFKP